MYTQVLTCASGGSRIELLMMVKIRQLWIWIYRALEHMASVVDRRGSNFLPTKNFKFQAACCAICWEIEQSCSLVVAGWSAPSLDCSCVCYCHFKLVCACRVVCPALLAQVLTAGTFAYNYLLKQLSLLGWTQFTKAFGLALLYMPYNKISSCTWRECCV